MLKEVVKSLKDVYGLTTQDIADRSKLSRRTVSRILAGELENPNLYTLVGLSECFGVPLDSLCLQRNDRMLRAEEFSDAMMFRALPPEYKERVIKCLHEVSNEWNEAVKNSYNLRKRAELRNSIDRLSTLDINIVQEFVDGLKGKL